ncbi:DUF4349 domain-containing protein [Paenibacillus aurantius]|uniref:DUF4349 domain-containing protein n=1 Tax=Paenibacillus aurantius TaxID=2918900 RepID=A0AA96RD63_9BACL|nr:DUF4349 domain-containing protein [Paenibacillus aurantius]WNQ11185.1 DUF4349 domain-containing protein [Paenibacillus aurantius]
MNHPSLQKRRNHPAGLPTLPILGKRFPAWLGALLLAAGIVSAAGCSSADKDTGATNASSAQSAPAKNEAKPAAGSGAAAGSAADQAGGKGTETADSKGGTAPVASSAPQPSGNAQAGGMTQADTSDGLNRKLIYKANLVMEVGDYNQAQSQIRDLVQLRGAYILQFAENQNSGEKGGNLTIKVPASGFSSLLSDLEKVESLKLQKSMQGQDVTEEYVDLDSRLKARQTAEARLLAFMEKASKADELVAFSNELGKVQEEIEKIKGRMRYLDQNVAMSTIELRLYEKVGLAASNKTGSTVPVLKQASQALSGSLNVMGIVFTKLFVFLAGALPVLIALAAVVVPAVLVNRRRSKAAAKPPELTD